MIDVDDLGKVVRPAGLAIRRVLARLARRGFTQGQPCRSGCKEIAAMKAGGDALWLPLDLPTSGDLGAALRNLQQAVARTDVPAAVGLDDDRRTIASDAGIHDAEKDRAERKPLGIGSQQISRGSGIARRRVREEIDDADPGCGLMQ